MCPKPIPLLVTYDTEQEYYEHFCRVYCSDDDPIYTFDGIRVDFYQGHFRHAFRKSADRRKSDKSVFSLERAKRIDRIKWALESPKGELFQGWNKHRRVIDPQRRVCVVLENYVVVIQLKDKKEAFFVTAFISDKRTLELIRSGPKWILV